MFQQLHFHSIVISTTRTGANSTDSTINQISRWRMRPSLSEQGFSLVERMVEY